MSYTGLPGTREDKLVLIKTMPNEELFIYYTLSCRSGEIEINLAGEHDFEQHALKEEFVERLRKAGFLS